MAKVVEELETGVMVTQVTEDAGAKENIYCELPWCDKYSHGFVYRQRTAEGGPNGSDYIYCKFGTWETEVIGTGLGSLRFLVSIHDQAIDSSGEGDHSAGDPRSVESASTDLEDCQPLRLE